MRDQDSSLCSHVLSQFAVLPSVPLSRFGPVASPRLSSSSSLCLPSSRVNVRRWLPHELFRKKVQRVKKKKRRNENGVSLLDELSLRHARIKIILLPFDIFLRFFLFSNLDFFSLFHSIEPYREKSNRFERIPSRFQP